MSVLDLMVTRRLTKLDGLISRLESLPSYENLIQNSDEPAIFDEEHEPSPGLINLIRRNSILQQTTSDTVRII